MKAIATNCVDSLLRGANLKAREDWKYGDIASLTSQNFLPFNGPVLSQTDFSEQISQDDNYKLVFINGIFDSSLSKMENLPSGVILRPLAQVDGLHPEQLAAFDQAPITALNSAFWQDGLYLKIADGVKVDRPIELYFLTTEQAGKALVSVRNLIEAGRDSELTVIEYFAGSAGETVLNTPVTEINCQQNSVVHHLKIIREGDKTLHYGSTHVHQKAGSSYTSREFALGGHSVRRELHLDLDGPNARCDMTALSMASDGQCRDMRTRVNHNVPGCQTNELYKSILDGNSRSIFDGLIKVAPDAQQTEAKQTNRNLVLSEDAVSYSIPRLEIYADDVKCSHGSTTGQLDEDQIFFLRSRGFDTQTSRILLANAFASEIIEGVPGADLRNSLTNEIATRLAAVPLGVGSVLEETA